MTANIVINVVNGRRQPFDPSAEELLVTAMDGRFKNVARDFASSARIRIPDLEVHDNLHDRHTVLLSAKDHTDAGFTPILVKANATHELHLMMLRRQATFAFDAFESIAARPHLHAFLRGDGTADARDVYEHLKKDKHTQPSLACLLNITTALEQMTLAPFDGLEQNPLASFKALQSAPQQDRFFAWCDSRLLTQVERTVDRKGDGLTRISHAPKGLHPGATHSFKQTDFGEGNVQLSFHGDTKGRIGDTDCIVVEADIDYFKDSAAHILLEVFPNKLKARVHGKDSGASMTDPRTVYGLRWIAGKQRGRDFAPPYVLN